jgi:AbrB family looped-hinge helix DNA binding protein
LRPVEFEIKVVKVGNSLRITLPKEICRAAGIERGATVAISVGDGEVIVRKVR